MKLAARMACRRSPAILKGQQPIIRQGQSGLNVLAACGFYELQESACQFANSPFLSLLQGFLWYELTAYAKCNCSCKNEFTCGLLIDTASGDQGNLWEWSFQRPDVTIAATLGARKYFHKIRAGLPCCDHFSGRKCACHHAQFFLCGELDDLQIETRAGQESNTYI